MQLLRSVNRARRSCVEVKLTSDNNGVSMDVSIPAAKGLGDLVLMRDSFVMEGGTLKGGC